MSIAPWLNVRRSTVARQFYKAAFGAAEIFCVHSPDGVVAPLAIEGSEFWMSEQGTHHANFSPETLNGSTMRLILTVEDVDVSFSRAVVAGAHVLCSIKDDNGWRVGRVADPYGHQWEIAREL